MSSSFDFSTLRGTLMIQGCTSDAGKTTVVAGLCRLLARQGVRVVPFKPQNMALNSAVTADGGEIGRAQALQAQAAGLAPHTDMNPVLLKPSSDTGAQVIVHGRVQGDMHARDYHQYKSVAMAAVLESHARLSAAYELVVVEGAGSPAEINLRDRDIANMGFAEAVDCPVILVADIDRGGVFAHLIGTLDCLSESERQRVVGFIINRFRGDISLLTPGCDWLEARTGKPVLGVLPYLHGLHLEAEDAIQTQQVPRADAGPVLRVVVPALPRVSNHTDLDALRAHPQVDLRFVGPDDPRREADLIILPGSKNTRADLDWLRRQGWEATLRRHLRLGGKLIGLCGGFQMLGEVVADPQGVEGPPGETLGLGYLPMRTELAGDKQLRNVRGRLALPDDGTAVDGRSAHGDVDGARVGAANANGVSHSSAAASSLIGYEIHMGRTTGPALARPLAWLHCADGDAHAEAPANHGASAVWPDGAISADDHILGTYVHGLFDDPTACAALLRWAGLEGAAGVDLVALSEASLDRLADTLAADLDPQRMQVVTAWRPMSAVNG